jgi:hypothetical protein
MVFSEKKLISGFSLSKWLGIKNGVFSQGWISLFSIVGYDLLRFLEKRGKAPFCHCFWHCLASFYNIANFCARTAMSIGTTQGISYYTEY